MKTQTVFVSQCLGCWLGSTKAVVSIHCSWLSSGKVQCSSKANKYANYLVRKDSAVVQTCLRRVIPYPESWKADGLKHSRRFSWFLTNSGTNTQHISCETHLQLTAWQLFQVNARDVPFSFMDWLEQSAVKQTFQLNDRAFWWFSGSWTWSFSRKSSFRWWLLLFFYKSNLTLVSMFLYFYINTWGVVRTLEKFKITSRFMFSQHPECKSTKTWKVVLYCFYKTRLALPVSSRRELGRDQNIKCKVGDKSGTPKRDFQFFTIKISHSRELGFWHLALLTPWLN